MTVARKQLAGYYRMREKLMTKEQRRDKESSAQSHRKKFDGQLFPSKAAFRQLVVAS